MSTETKTTNAERLARGELSVPSDYRCEFCGAGRDQTTRTSVTEGVAQHSHTGTRHTVTECDACGAEFVVTAMVQTRTNLPSRPVEESIQWAIPEGFCKPYCVECGATSAGIEICEGNEELLESLHASGDATCPRCGGATALMVEWLKRKPPEPSAATEVTGR